MGILEELANFPQWNVIGNCLKNKFKEMESEELDNLNEDIIRGILVENFEDECLELVSRLVMEKIREEWRNEGQDEFDKFLRGLK